MGWPPDIVPSREETDERARQEREELRKRGLKICPACGGSGKRYGSRPSSSYGGMMDGEPAADCGRCGGSGVVKRFWS